MKLFLTLALGSVASLPGSAQSQAQPPVTGPPGTPITRSIEGIVMDAHGSAVGNAVILLKDTKTLQVRSYLAQKDGKYHFYGLSSDINYEVRAQANGLTSPIKTVSVFDSHQIVVLNLKINKKIKP